MEEHNNHGKFLAGLFVGGLIGAGIIFLLGTKEGRKVGKMIQKKGEDVLEDIEEKVGDLQEKGKELIKDGEELKERLIADVSHKEKIITHDVAKRIDGALAQVEKVQEKGLETTGNLRRHFKNIPKR